MRQIAVTLVLVLVIVCGLQVAFTAAPQAAEKTKISVEMSIYVEAPHKKAFDMLKKRYEELNPNVEIELYGAPFAEFWDKLTTEITAGTEACIVQLQGGNTRYASYAALRQGESGAFVNLDKYVKGTPLETGLTGQKDLTYKGHYIGLSNYAWGARAVYYRKSLLKAAGINADSIKTTEDFLKAAIKLTKKGEGGKPGQYGFGAVLSTHSFVWDEMKTFISRPASGGVYFPNEAPPYTPDRVRVNSEAMVWAWQWWQDMIFKHKVVPPGSFDKAQERDLFWNGTAAMNIDGPWFVGMTREKSAALINDLGVIASPDVLYKGKNYPFYGQVSTITHLISSNCKTPDQAWKFMEWMAGDEASRIISVSGMIPANTKYSTSAEYQKAEPLNAQLVQLVKQRYKVPSINDPNIPQMGEMHRAMIDAAQEAFITQKPVKATLDKAAAQIKKILTK
jgi:ABC-type glycerol-3-phosphate transport system substrate-binding protein